MNDTVNLDSLFREAVAAIDAGDVSELGRLLTAHPILLGARLEQPGQWLIDKVGSASEGYFKAPYLLWFVAENPVRNDKLPQNIVEITRTIIEAAKRKGTSSLDEQLSYTLALVCTGRVSREQGVQLEMIDLLIDAGAKPAGGIGALAGGNLEAAEHLVKRGEEMTLAVAACLGRVAEMSRLIQTASAQDKQTALAGAAFNGNVGALKQLINLDVDLSSYSTGIHEHATPLHHAVCSGSLEAVKVLVEAGADLGVTDKVYQGTPLDWAEHAGQEEIAIYLREKNGK